LSLSTGSAGWLVLTGCIDLTVMKYRLCISVPVLAYKCVTGTVAVAVLLGFALHWLQTCRGARIYDGDIAENRYVSLTAFIRHPTAATILRERLGLVASNAAPFLSGSRTMGSVQLTINVHSVVTDRYPVTRLHLG
jgi:hypothetical protein